MRGGDGLQRFEDGDFAVARHEDIEHGSELFDRPRGATQHTPFPFMFRSGIDKRDMRAA